MPEIINNTTLGIPKKVIVPNTMTPHIIRTTPIILLFLKYRITNRAEKFIAIKITTCIIVPPKNSPSIGIPIKEFIKIYVTSIRIETNNPSIVFINVNFLYKCNLF
ncbi:MAG TPA: hypothetical protein VLA74_14270 [Nitrososphaeraceae archaeon]|nr:hypothetical protein [Nitrososphaeraceae archaeon]